MRLANKMKYMYAGSLMERRYDIGDTISKDQLNQKSDYRVIDIHIDSDTGGVGYDLKEIIPHEDHMFVDENELIN